ncbi:hypothetical protein [Leptothoe sp. PORK10 BA2]|uniref:hypothetical protein n=1 Tax=Leptothoe sp. PORK10 BA2 TaxID=3110254 RepID=UPI002B21E1EE|nr:hypothetical protein [Leptothoe sp. PORK10 BA2]MEA5463136.1 hypothetical protein [Leptothoe sp. PORK10 BA2]
MLAKGSVIAGVRNNRVDIAIALSTALGLMLGLLEYGSEVWRCHSRRCWLWGLPSHRVSPGKSSPELGRDATLLD